MPRKEMEISLSHATMPLLKGSGLKNRNHKGFFPSEKVLKTFWDGGDQGCRIISVTIGIFYHNYEQIGISTRKGQTLWD